MKELIEKELQAKSFVEADCAENCNSRVNKSKRREVIDYEDVKFLIVISSRGVQTMEGYQFSRHQVNILDEVTVREIYN